MGITKNAIIRYNTLDRCFRNPGRNYLINDLLDACNDALNDFDHNSKGIQKRQLYDDIRFMESSQGWSISLDKVRDGRNVYYRYEDISFSINNQPINELEADQIKSAILVLSRFKGLPQFEWINELLLKLDKSFNLSDNSEEIISFDSNEFLQGTEYITPLFNAILYNQTLEVSYQSFKSEVPQVIVFHPYHLKQYNNRWFVFGKNSDFDNLTNLALDRIINVADSKKKYIPNTKIDFEEYFEDFIGVSKTDEEDLTTIILNALPDLAPYILTKPLHGSQTKINQNERGFTFSIEVIPNIELEKLIMSFGEELKVIEPIDFKNRIKDRLIKNLNNYN